MLCLAVSVTAQGRKSVQGWVWQNPLPQGNSILSIHFTADKQTGWAVGAGGVILYTKDGGFNWTQQHSGVASTLSGVYARSKTQAVAVGARGVILSTSDSGANWQRIGAGVKDHLY